MEQETMPAIARDEDWLDLRTGDVGMLRGRLHGPLRRGDAGMIVSTVAWEIVAVTIDPPYAGPVAAAGRSVAVRIVRGEDGPAATSDDITINEEIEA